MKRNMNNFLRGGLFLFLLVMSVIVAFADPARVVSKQENVPLNGNMETRIFLDITPNDGNNRADAYLKLYGTNLRVSIQEFSDMIQVGDIIDYNPTPHPIKDGRFIVIPPGYATHLNSRNIYLIFVNELEDELQGRMFIDARHEYETQQRQSTR